jgi:hypothetical protein
MSSELTKIKINVGEVEVVDIPTMNGMSNEQYREFIRNDGLILVDHHDVLRSSIAGYPLATTREQLDILIQELQALRSKMT